MNGWKIEKWWKYSYFTRKEKEKRKGMKWRVMILSSWFLLFTLFSIFEWSVFFIIFNSHSVEHFTTFRYLPTHSSFLCFVKPTSQQRQRHRHNPSTSSPLQWQSQFTFHLQSHLEFQHTIQFNIPVFHEFSIFFLLVLPFFSLFLICQQNILRNGKEWLGIVWIKVRKIWK